MPPGSRCCCRTWQPENADRWPAFTPAALAAGVRAEFSLPLTVGSGGIGTFDLCRDRPGMLSDEHLADALVAADIARDACCTSRTR